MAFGGSDGNINVNMLEGNDANPILSDDKIENGDTCPNNSDSLSSSASISDSDLTSTDSEDSLALSESESITDVTPLNSPYCDSPLPPNRLHEHKSEDKIHSNKSVRYVEPGADSCPPEMNVLMQVIEKLEMEAKKTEQPVIKSSSRRRTVSYSGDDNKRLELENQKLLKRVISQQNRIRAMHPSTSQGTRKHLKKHQELVKSDGDISSLPRSSQSPKYSKDDSKYARRQQKCLSHPSCTNSQVSIGEKLPLNADISCVITKSTKEMKIKSASPSFKVLSKREKLVKE